jgi:hypothetical protein
MTVWGQRVECERCHRDSYTGSVCTACFVAGGTETGFAWSSMGTHFSAPENGSERVELVPPEFVCPPAREGGCEHVPPGPVSDLCDLAWANGWQHEYRHSRGGVVGGTGKQLAVADTWSVRFRRDGWMGYAVRRGAAWSSVCVAGEKLPPFMKLGVTGLKVWLAEPDQPASWYAEVVRIEAERAAAQKERAKASAAARGTKRIDHAD